MEEPLKFACLPRRRGDRIHSTREFERPAGNATMLAHAWSRNVLKHGWHDPKPIATEPPGTHVDHELPRSCGALVAASRVFGQRTSWKSNHAGPRLPLPHATSSRFRRGFGQKYDRWTDMPEHDDQNRIFKYLLMVLVVLHLQIIQGFPKGADVRSVLGRASRREPRVPLSKGCFQGFSTGFL